LQANACPDARGELQTDDVSLGERKGRRQSRGGNEAVPGTRASANTSGPDFTLGFGPGEIAELEIRTERRKPVSSAGPFSRANSLKITIQPFDLMSRRHPLVDQSCLMWICLKRIVFKALVTLPASSRRQF
jgi:hypothetical protein